MDRFVGISLAVENLYHRTFQQLTATFVSSSSKQLLKSLVK